MPMTNDNLRPPRFAEKLLGWCLRLDERSHRLGDFEEVHADMAARSGRIRAGLW